MNIVLKIKIVFLSLIIHNSYESGYDFNLNHNFERHHQLISGHGVHPSSPAVPSTPVATGLQGSNGIHKHYQWYYNYDNTGHNSAGIPEIPNHISHHFPDKYSENSAGRWDANHEFPFADHNDRRSYRRHAFDIPAIPPIAAIPGIPELSHSYFGHNRGPEYSDWHSNQHKNNHNINIQQNDNDYKTNQVTNKNTDNNGRHYSLHHENERWYHNRHTSGNSYHWGSDGDRPQGVTTRTKWKRHHNSPVNKMWFKTYIPMSTVATPVPHHSHVLDHRPKWDAHFTHRTDDGVPIPTMADHYLPMPSINEKVFKNNVYYKEFHYSWDINDHK